MLKLYLYYVIKQLLQKERQINTQIKLSEGLIILG